jgi:phospholipase A1
MRAPHVVRGCRLGLALAAVVALTACAAVPVPGGGPSALSERWELEPDTTLPRYKVRPHRETYVLPVNWSDDPNQEVIDDEAAASGRTPIELDPVEVKFQLSLKVKAVEDLALGGDLWLGYTQSSRWQAYNSDSAPFRETNYEPEVTWVVPLDTELVGWRARMLGFGFVHQSNGRTEPLSRSWNRLFALAGVERGPWAVVLRPWWRFPESDGEDDNPNIEHYLGYGDLQLVYRQDEHVVSALLRNNLETDDNKGSVQLEWSMQLTEALRGFVQVFSGYGESLLDYDHQQNTIGIGLVFVDAL